MLVLLAATELAVSANVLQVEFVNLGLNQLDISLTPQLPQPLHLTSLTLATTDVLNVLPSTLLLVTSVQQDMF